MCPKLQDPFQGAKIDATIVQSLIPEEGYQP